MDRDSAFNVRQISDDLITQLLPVSDVGRCAIYLGIQAMWIVLDVGFHFSSIFSRTFPYLTDLLTLVNIEGSKFINYIW